MGEKRSATAHLGIATSASYAVRTAIEKVLYGLAQQHAADAEVACKNGERNDELNHAIQGVILAAACLEAFINEEAIHLLDKQFNDYDMGKVDAHGNTLSKIRGYPKLEEKWCEITERVSGGKKFKKGKPPFKDFQKLVGLRNYILHYKGRAVAPVPPTCHHVPGVVPPERAKFTAKAVQEAVKSMKAMLEEFYSMTCKQQPEWIK